MGPTWGPPESCRPQMVPTLAPWALLSGMGYGSLTYEWRGSGTCVSIKTIFHLPAYVDSHYKHKTVCRPSYSNNRKSYTDKAVHFNWDSPIYSIWTFDVSKHGLIRTYLNTCVIYIFCQISLSWGLLILLDPRKHGVWKLYKNSQSSRRASTHVVTDRHFLAQRKSDQPSSFVIALDAVYCDTRPRYIESIIICSRYNCHIKYGRIFISKCPPRIFIPLKVCLTKICTRAKLVDIDERPLSEYIYIYIYIYIYRSFNSAVYACNGVIYAVVALSVCWAIILNDKTVFPIISRCQVATCSLNMSSWKKDKFSPQHQGVNNHDIDLVIPE